jgi:Protein of unknown function (DUF1214)
VSVEQPTPTWEASVAWRELMDGLRDLDQCFLTGTKALTDEQSVAEGYRSLATALGVALDINFFADRDKPRFYDINTPFRHDRRWGGDNTDAYYAFAPVDPTRSYRVTGQRGDSIYFSLTVYNEPSPGQWSDFIVGIVNDSDLTFDKDGNFEIVLGPRRPAGYDGAFLELRHDSGAMMTRDYQVFPKTGRRVTWEVEALEPAPIKATTDAVTAEKLRATTFWLQQMFAILPLTVAERTEGEMTAGHKPVGAANQCGEPYQILDTSYGWSARDACYSFGSFVLNPGEALVITHRPPECRFWNLTVWNEFMACHDLDYTTASVNHGSATRNSDGTVTTVIARELLDHPNAISTADHGQGQMSFRWFQTNGVVPEQPVATLMPVDQVPRSVT